jgi:hypothetical protein
MNRRKRFAQLGDRITQSKFQYFIITKKRNFVASTYHLTELIMVLKCIKLPRTSETLQVHV